LFKSQTLQLGVKCRGQPDKGQGVSCLQLSSRAGLEDAGGVPAHTELYYKYWQAALIMLEEHHHWKLASCEVKPSWPGSTSS
jgi:hypothetical protein